MNLTKKKTALLALTLIAVFAIGVYAGVQLAPKYVYVTVEEAISVAPDFVEVSMYPGETETANFTITNLASVAIPLSITANVTLFPEGGNPADLTLEYPETLSVEPGDTTLTIAITAASGTVPGDYEITVIVTRV